MENDIYEGGNVTAEYDVYIGSATANQSAVGGVTTEARDGENKQMSEESADCNVYDLYAGCTSHLDDVIMTENDVYARD